MLNIAQKRVWPAAVIALAAAVGAVAVVLASQSTDATSAPTASPVSKLSVLEPVTPAALYTIPEETRARLDFMASNPGLPDAGAVSEVGVVKRRDGSDVTVAALGGSICAFMAEGLGLCDEGRKVASGQSFSVAPAGCDSYQVLGVAPDEVTRIAIDSGADGTRDVTLPVRSNVYVGVLDPVRTIATGLDESGAARFTVGMPLDSYASMNDACK